MSDLGNVLLLAVVQGVTEFLPVSSSGHLEALEEILGTSPGGERALFLFLHLGSLLAVLVGFRTEVGRMLHGLLRGGRGRGLLFRVVLAAIPAGIAGLLLKDHLEPISSRWPYSLPLCWLITAGILYSQKGLPPGGREIDWRGALWVGAWQILALLPGISRSGITITAALWYGSRRDEAASFSFLTALPLILGATLYEGLQLARGDEELLVAPATILLGVAIAFVTGLLALRLLLGMLRRGRLYLWAWYLLGLAACLGVWRSLP